MKSNEKLSPDARLEHAKNMLVKCCQEFGINQDHLDKFYVRSYQRKDEMKAFLNTIDGGVHHWSFNSDHKLEHTNKMATEHAAELVLCHFLRSSPSGCCLDPSEVMSSANKNKREVIQICVLQILALREEITADTFFWYRQIVKYYRNLLDTGRVALLLSGQPAYTPPIQHVNTFIRILEERVKIWDTPTPVKKTRKTKKA